MKNRSRETMSGKPGKFACLPTNQNWVKGHDALDLIMKCSFVALVATGGDVNAAIERLLR